MVVTSSGHWREREVRPWQSLPVGTRKRGEAAVVTSSHSGDRLRTLWRNAWQKQSSGREGRRPCVVGRETRWR